jgi:hypothetical protein
VSQLDPETDRQLFLADGDHRATVALVRRPSVDSLSSAHHYMSLLPLAHLDIGHNTNHTWFVKCFGFINAEGYFNATLAPLMKHWRQQGFRVPYFGDDILSLTPGVLGAIGPKQLLYYIPTTQRKHAIPRSHH